MVDFHKFGINSLDVSEKMHFTDGRTDNDDGRLRHSNSSADTVK